MAEPERSPLDRLLDVAVYGPVGMALAARDSLPKWVEVGRRQLGSQLGMAKTIGRFAVDRGSRQADTVLRRLAQEAEGVLVALGLVPAADDLDDDAPETGRADPDRAETSVTPATSPNGAGETASTTTATDQALRLDPADLPIPGYDTLSASQIVQRLPGLSPEELEAVRLYELAGRSRKTVLLRIAQLKAGS